MVHGRLQHCADSTTVSNQKLSNIPPPLLPLWSGPT